MDEWKRNVHKAGFAAANHLPPKLKPRKHFVQTPREVFGRIVQCRTGHVFIGEYYATIVPYKPVDCICEDGYQTRAHSLRDCPRSNDHRHILVKGSLTMSMYELLGSEKWVRALTAASGAFISHVSCTVTCCASISKCTSNANHTYHTLRPIVA